MTDTRDVFEKVLIEFEDSVREHCAQICRNGHPDDVAYWAKLRDSARAYLLRAWQAALQSGAGDGVLTKPARVGCTSFNKGVNERLVIECAQRNYEYWKNPPDIDTEGLAKLFGVHPRTDKKDAERYRFLRDANRKRHEGLHQAIEYGSDHLDAAIDNAQATEGK